MKKLFFPLLALLVLLSACGKKESQASQGLTTVPEVPETTAIEEAEEETYVLYEYDEAYGPSDLELAQECVGDLVEYLTSLIGQPTESTYTTSQRNLTGEDAQDGLLYYDGFIVYTYRENDTEWVEHVEEIDQE